MGDDHHRDLTSKFGQRCPNESSRFVRPERMWVRRAPEVQAGRRGREQWTSVGVDRRTVGFRALRDGCRSRVGGPRCPARRSPGEPPGVAQVSSMPSRKKRMFSATVPVMRRASCATNATRRLHHERSTSRRSVPPTSNAALRGGAQSQAATGPRVDLPAPDGPITPTTSPLAMREVDPGQRRPLDGIGELDVLGFERGQAARDRLAAVGRRRLDTAPLSPHVVEERRV